MSKIKALFLAANPADTSRLKLDEEIREITAKIRAAEYRDRIELVSLWAVRPDDLLQALNTHKPQIVHFSGHGSRQGEIILLDESGASKPVSAAALQALFKTLKDNIRLVILNACYSRQQALAIVEVIDNVIGMKEAIGDRAAISFAASLYRAIGFGRSVQEAFEQGRVALMLEGIPEENTPELLTRSGVDPARVSLIEPMIREDTPPVPVPGLVQDLRADLQREGYTRVESPEWLALVMSKQTMGGLIPKVVAVSMAIPTTGVTASPQDTFERFKKWSKGLLGNQGMATLVFVYQGPPIAEIETILKLGRGMLGYGQIVPYVYDASSRTFWSWQPMLGILKSDKIK